MLKILSSQYVIRMKILRFYVLFSPIISLWNLAFALYLQHISVQMNHSSSCHVADGSRLRCADLILAWIPLVIGISLPSGKFTSSLQALGWELPYKTIRNGQFYSLHLQAGWQHLQRIILQKFGGSNPLKFSPPAPSSHTASVSNPEMVPVIAACKPQFSRSRTRLREVEWCSHGYPARGGRAGTPSQGVETSSSSVVKGSSLLSMTWFQRTSQTLSPSSRHTGPAHVVQTELQMARSHTALVARLGQTPVSPWALGLSSYSSSL